MDWVHPNCYSRFMHTINTWAYTIAIHKVPILNYQFNQSKLIAFLTMWCTFKWDLLERGFGQKILVFLNKNVVVKDYEISDMKTWIAEMAIGGPHVPLYTVEDDNGIWSEPLCKHCSIAGKVPNLVSTIMIFCIERLKDSTF